MLKWEDAWDCDEVEGILALFVCEAEFRTNLRDAAETLLPGRRACHNYLESSPLALSQRCLHYDT